MDKARLDGDVTDCCYPFGSPNPRRVGFARFRSASHVSAAGIAAVADLLGRPARIEDEQGYEVAIVAGAVHPGEGWPAWVECRCRIPSGGGYVDVEFRLKSLAGEAPGLDWVLDCYNPYFGCHVGFLAWHGDDVILIYREKHRTYACSLRPGRPATAVTVADEWLVGDGVLAYRDRENGGVRLLSLPGLSPAGTLDAEQARARGLLPPGYDDAERLRLRLEQERRRPS
jgi:hypothetical protein